jgi:tRNA pseudouridine55 synthase
MAFMDGILIIDKQPGLTSHDVVAGVRRMLREKSVGHTGTLDPFATGVLVILVGRATRLAQFLSGAEKEYEAVIRLGYATDTGDLTGLRISDAAGKEERAPESWRDEEIASAMASLRGEIEQTPPMYSAKKIAGRKLYELARRGEEIAREAVRVKINEFESLARNGQLLSKNEDGTCDLAVRVVCSAGTYIRTLAEDLGRRLGVGAHLVALRRTRAGDFSVAAALTLQNLQRTLAERTGPDFDNVMLSMNVALSRFPFLLLTKPNAERVRHGMTLPIEARVGASWSDGEKVRMGDEEGNLIAIGFFDGSSRMLHPRVVLASEAM